MNSALLVRKIIEDIAKEFKLKSSNMHPSDADWYIGFGDDKNTANEVIHNTDIADRPTYLQHWDGDNTGYVEEDDVKRDRGIGYQMHAMDQITPIK